MSQYKIKPNETLTDIARNNNTTVDEILKANPSIKNPNLIYAGSSITIPGMGDTSAAGLTSGTDTAGTAAGTTGNTTGTAANTNTNTNTNTSTVPDYSGYQYDPSGETAFQTAYTALQNAQKNKPTYAGTYDAPLEDIYNKIINREGFKYDLNSDMLYQQYADQYDQKGRMAMMDTMGQAAALTGGYGNSYSQAVGQQQYDAYLQNLNDVVPDLYNMALQRYTAEGNELNNQFALVGALRDNEYGLYQDELDRYWQNVNYYQNQADTEYDRGYQKWYNAYQMGQTQEETDYNRQQDYYERLMGLITSAGYTPSADELTRAGMSEGEAQAYLSYYNQNNASSGGGYSYSGGGGSGGNSTTIKNPTAGNNMGNAIANSTIVATGGAGTYGGSVYETSGFTGNTYESASSYLASRGIGQDVIARNVLSATEWDKKRAKYAQSKKYDPASVPEGTVGTEASYQVYLQNIVNTLLSVYG